MKQPEALRLLIEDLELNHEYCEKEIILKAADELRRLHEEAKINTALERLLNKYCHALERLHKTNKELAQALEIILETNPAIGMNSDAVIDWNVHMIAKAALAKAQGEKE